MTSAQARNAYRRTEKMAAIHPVKLIHLMYERIIAHLDLVVEGIDQGNVIKRGENLGKAIAIITELNASIKTDDQSEAAAFLRGLYTSILVELPKVSIKNDKAIAVKAQEVYQAVDGDLGADGHAGKRPAGRAQSGSAGRAASRQLDACGGPGKGAARGQKNCGEGGGRRIVLFHLIAEASRVPGG